MRKSPLTTSSLPKPPVKLQFSESQDKNTFGPLVVKPSNHPFHEQTWSVCPADTTGLLLLELFQSFGRDFFHALLPGNLNQLWEAQRIKMTGVSSMGLKATKEKPSYIYIMIPHLSGHFSLHCQTNLSCFKWPGPSGQKKGVKANVSKRLATNQSRGGGDGGGVATLEKERRQAFDEPSSKFHQTSASRNNDSTPFRPFFTALPDESELFQMTRPFRPKERCQGQCLQEIGHKSKSHNP